MNFADLRRRAAVVRELPLETVLQLRGAVRDPHDKSKWHSERGLLSVSGPKFMNWQQGLGGGGAIDLVMHLGNVDFIAAVAWLEQNVSTGHVAMEKVTPQSSFQAPAVPQAHRQLRLPASDHRQLGHVLSYLTDCRHLATSLLEGLCKSGKLYADARGNAVFVLVAGKANRPVGAELRGTGPRVWRGMAPGTRKDLGYFWIGTKGSRELVLCESAIDAISCHQIQPHRICISTSGVRANPSWLSGLLSRSYQTYCGFDADHAGDAAARQMLVLHPTVKRLRPPVHDWNDALASGF